MLLLEVQRKETKEERHCMFKEIIGGNLKKERKMSTGPHVYMAASSVRFKAQIGFSAGVPIAIISRITHTPGTHTHLQH